MSFMLILGFKENFPRIFKDVKKNTSQKKSFVN